MKALNRRFFFAALTVLVFLALPMRAAALTRAEIVSEAAVLMDAETGQVLFDKNSDKLMFPASTTKIMTGLLTVEQCSMNELALVTDSSVDVGDWGSSNIALVPGEQMTVDSLMYAMMLKSANDAAKVLAEHIAEDESKFAGLMNERARKIGAMDTHFENAHGLHNQAHYTTAGDLALITREAIKNPLFLKYFGSEEYTIPPTNLNPQSRTATNYQYMLIRTSPFFDPDVIGGKVGYTQPAQHTMSTAATRGDRTLICVALYTRNRDDKFTDTKKLLDFGFDEFTEITVPKESFPGFDTQILDGEWEVGTVSFSSQSDFKALLHHSADPDALAIAYSHDRPFSPDETISADAVFTVPSDNPAIPAVVGTAPLLADETIYAWAGSALLSFRGGKTASGWWFWPLAILIVVLLLVCGFFAARSYSTYKQQLRRRNRLRR